MLRRLYKHNKPVLQATRLNIDFKFLNPYCHINIQQYQTLQISRIIT